MENLKFWNKIRSPFKGMFNNNGNGQELTEEDIKKRKEKRKELLINNLLYFLIIIYVIAVSISNPRFISFNNIVNILNQMASRLPIALGVAGAIVLTGTDLSAGRVIGLTACITASLLQSQDYAFKMFPALGDVPVIVVVLIVVLVGGLIGLFNGFFIARFKLHPFIVTLSTQLIVYATTLYYITLGTNDGKPIGGIREDVRQLVVGGFELFGVRIQYQILYAILVTILVWFIWNKTVFGKNMFAVGSNPEAANVSGISVNKTIIATFTLAAMLYGFNGFIQSINIGSNNAATGVNFELDAIAAAVIGGVSFSGGVGRISGVVLGVFLLQLITSSFIFLGIAPNLQYVIKGFIILFACAIDMRKYITRR